MESHGYRAHLIRENKQSRMPKHVVFLGVTYERREEGRDCIAERLYPVRFAASWWKVDSGRYQRRLYAEYDSAVQLRVAVAGFGRESERLWLYAERLVPVLASAGFFSDEPATLSRLRNWSVGDPPTTLDGWSGRRRVTLCDSRNLGVEAGRWLAGCQKAVEGAEETVIPFLNFALHNDLGNWSSTLGGIAWNSYRHKHMRRAIEVDEVTDDYEVVSRIKTVNLKVLAHHVPDVLALERRAYYGGQVWIGREGVLPGEVYHLDVNGLYPTMMAASLMPRALCRWGRVSTPKLLQEVTRNAVVCADVEIDSNDMAYPVRLKNKVVYATGHFLTTLCTPELNNAIHNGHVVATGMWSCYEQCVMFDEWFEWWGRRKLAAQCDGNEVETEICKLIMNALYGRFGVHTDGWQFVRGVESKQPFGRYWQTDPHTGTPLWCRSVLDLCKVHYRQGECRDSIPIVSAVISGYGREYMRKLRGIAHESNVYYQDTDSLMVSQPGYERLAAGRWIDPTRFGKLKRVDSCGRVEIIGAKQYLWGDTLVACGVKGDAVEVEPRVYEMDGYQGAGPLLEQRPNGTIAVTRYRRTVRTAARSYVVSDDGRCGPIHLQEKESR